MISTVITAAREGLSRAQRVRFAGWLLCVAIVTLAFSPVLASLVRHALANPLHSHIPLIPLITAYLLYIQPNRSAVTYSSATAAGIMCCACALGLAVIGIAAADRLSVNDYLATMTLAFVSLMWASGFLVLGSSWMRASAFPLAFLLFMVPLPDTAVDVLEMTSVWASADAAAAIFRIIGTPLLRDGTIFALPGVVLEVARECSGIRSSWVLFITSVLAANMLLATPGRRLALIAFSLPLAIVRNASRIVTIGLLAVYVGPHTLNSPIHMQGGPLFFVVSLVPLFAVLVFLRRQERPSPSKA